MESPSDVNQQRAPQHGAERLHRHHLGPGPAGVALDAEHPDRLQQLARRNLWMHFTRMGSYDEHHAVPVIVRGEGCYVYDEHGKRYLDGLSALYCVNVGHGRAELGEAAAAQIAQLGFYTNWSYAHPPSIELAARVARASRPGNLNRVFFTSGGSEAVESAWKLAKAYHRARGEHEPPQADLAQARLPRHLDGRADGDRACRRCATPFEPLTPGGVHVPNTNSYRWSEERDPLWAADAIEEAIEFEGPDTVAAVILEPVQNGGGCFVPQDGYFQRVREICDRHGVLLISDEVICSWGRLGHWFGCERYGYQPDMITTAKGISSAYAPLGAVIAGDHIAEPFLHGKAIVHPRLHVRRPPGRLRGRARQHRHPRARGAAASTCAPTRARFRAMLECAARPADRGRRARRRLLPGDRARQGQGARRRPSTPSESEQLLRGFLSGELYRRGLICRTDDRGDPIVQLSPPLIAGPEQFEEIEAVLRPVLTEASERMESVELTVESLIGELGLELVCGQRRRAGARALGPQHRAARPHAVAERRRAAAEHRPAADRARSAARADRAPRRPRDRRARLRHRASRTSASRRRS